MVGKLLIQPHIGKNSGGKSDPDHESLLESQLKTLRSPDMRKLAEAAILNDHPDWKPSEIKLDVERIRRSSVVSITGRGSDPDCARVLIDGVMNLYVASVSPVRPVVDPKNTGGDAASVERGLQDAERAWNSFKLENDQSHFSSDLAAVQRRLKQFKTAKNFYQQEMDTCLRLTLEQDIERRKASSALPPDMPAEFGVMARINPTANEFALLSALKQPNTAAIEAARKQAASDRQARMDSHRRQLEILNDLLATTAADADKMTVLQVQAQTNEQKFKSAEAAYNLFKSSEKNAEINSYSSVAPGLVASVLQYSIVTADSN